MTDGSFELKEFEHVEAIPGKALLRVTAATSFPSTDIQLVIDDSDHVGPLPAPLGPAGVTRVAFSVPSELAERATSYALELSGGQRIVLPAPRRRQSTRIALAGAGLAGPAPAPAEPVDAGASDLNAELERRLEAERARRVSADTAAQTSAAARGASEARLTTLEDELAGARTDLEATREALASTRAQLSAARGEAEAAETTLLRRAAEIQLLRQGLSDRDLHAQAADLQWEQIIAELTAELEVARQVAADFQQHARNLQLELADAKLELSSLEGQPVAGTPVEGEDDDPAVLVAKLNAAAAGLEQARSRAAAAEAELDRLGGQLPPAS